LDSDQPGKAIAEADAAERLVPSRFESAATEAAALARAGQLDQALLAIQRAITLAPPTKRDQLRSVQSDLNQEIRVQSAANDARKLMSNGNYGGAAEAFGRAAALDPKREDLLLSQANAYLLAGNSGAATNRYGGIQFGLTPAFDEETSTFASEPFCRSQPNAAVRATNDHNFVVEPTHISPPPIDCTKHRLAEAPPGFGPSAR